MVRYFPALRPLMVPIDSIRQHPENYNNGDIDAIRESIEVNGMYRPVEYQQATGFITAGNHTWQVCKELDAEHIPAVPLDVDDATAIRMMLADNHTAWLARPDKSAELALVERLYELRDMAGSSYNEFDLTVLRHLADIQPNYDDVAMWPVITVRVPPHVRNAYLDMTRECVDDRDKFELLLRLAGWQG